MKRQEAQEVPMSALIFGSVSRDMTLAGCVPKRLLSAHSAPAESPNLNSMTVSSPNKPSRDAHLQAVGPGEQGAVRHSDGGPLSDERGPHARLEEGGNFMPGAVLIR